MHAILTELLEFQTSLTINNCQNYKCLQLFAISLWLDKKMEQTLFLFLHNDKCPEILIITVRHKDWKSYTSDGPLTPLAEQQWLQHLLRYNTPPRLREIRLELETMQVRVKQLRSMVNRIRQKFKLVKRRVPSGGDVHVRLLEPPSEVKWYEPICAGNKYGLPGSYLTVMTIVWRIHPAPLDVVELKREYGAEDDILEHLRSSSRTVAASEAASLTDEHNSTEEPVLNDPEAAFFAASLPEGSLLKLAPKESSDDDDDDDNGNEANIL